MINKAFQDPELAQRLLKKIKALNTKPVSIMEVCGTHTMALFQHGIRSLLPSGVTLLSGPGCPVCVTSQGEMDAFMSLTENPDIIATVFGDLLRVPGSSTSLQKERAKGCDVRVVYSPLDAVLVAQKNPDKEVVFFGVGFETTAPAIAGAVLMAKANGIKNFTVLAALKRVMPALFALMDDPDTRIDGFLCPGHVSVILGADAYKPVAEKTKAPCVIAGFEPLDMLQGVYMILCQIKKSVAYVENSYGRAVSSEGNEEARKIIDMVFEKNDAVWRGLGPIPLSGFTFRQSFSFFDARKRHDLKEFDAPEPPGCKCGDILKGIMQPDKCPLYKSHCTPEHPIGPCMVSSEGACAAHYKYR